MNRITKAIYTYLEHGQGHLIEYEKFLAGDAPRDGQPVLFIRVGRLELWIERAAALKTPKAHGQPSVPLLGLQWDAEGSQPSVNFMTRLGFTGWFQWLSKMPKEDIHREDAAHEAEEMLRAHLWRVVLVSAYTSDTLH